MKAPSGRQSIDRYNAAATQVKGERGWRVMRSPGPPTAPYAPEYNEVQIFMGSHVDEDPATEDRVEVWSSYRRPEGGEMMVQEYFVQRNERSWFKSRPVLHHAAVQIRIPGGHYLDAVVTSIDLATGEIFRSEQGDDAFDAIRKLGLTEDANQHNPPPHALVARPRLEPQEVVDPAEEVRDTARGLTEAPAGVEVTEEVVHVGDKTLEIRTDRE